MKKGFTLIELLVVIFIIGILASLLLSNMIGIRTRAEDTQLKNDLDQMKKALRLYYNDNQSYPSGDGSSKIDSGLITTDGAFADGTTIYMNDLPQDYKYYVSSDGEAFRLIGTVETISSSDVATSQAKCPITGDFTSLIGSYDANMYVVCVE